jgi:hypothetical protein
VDDQHRPGLRPKRAAVIALYTAPPAGVTVVSADELGPVIPCSFPPAPGWTADDHRVKAPLDYGCGPEKTWVYGALRVRDGQTVTLAAPSRNSVGYQRLLAAVEAANPAGAITVVTDNLSSHSSVSTRAWLVDHPRIQHAFIPKADPTLGRFLLAGATWMFTNHAAAVKAALRQQNRPVRARLSIDRTLLSTSRGTTFAYTRPSITILSGS